MFPKDSKTERALNDQLTAHPQFGVERYCWSSAPQKRHASRSLVLLGIIAALLVPIGIKYVPGVLGTIVAVLGGLVALLCYWASGRHSLAPGIELRVYERGLICSQGKAARKLSWNEIVEVTSRRLTLPNGAPSLAVAFEVVGEEPLLLLLNTGNQQHSKQLLEAISSAWLQIWCRRARALLQSDQPLTVGCAKLSLVGISVGEQVLHWTEIQGVEDSSENTTLQTGKGQLNVESANRNVPFPSAAHRLAALAKTTSSFLLTPRH